MRVLVLGASGMLGNAMFRVLSEQEDLDVFGTTRSAGVRNSFPEALAAKILAGVDIENMDSLVRLFDSYRPNVVVNCIGLVKQLAESNDPLMALPINALLPHRLARLSALIEARFVHVSTDCVFSGLKGNYRESDIPDARDLYGLSKHLGEVAYPNSITLRTSIIGHELNGNHGLVDWFLTQQVGVRGFRKAIFSGLPTFELAMVVRDLVLPKQTLSGLYHVAAAPIAKYDLLKLVADVYGKNIAIEPDDSVVVDRSLNADCFREATGYIAPPWQEMVTRMRDSSERHRHVRW